VPGVTIRCNRRRLGSSRAKAAITARSAQSGFGRDLMAQDRDLMPQQQDLDVLRGAAAGDQRHPDEQPDHKQVKEAEEHECRG
jgi:hypothetical protein